MILKTLGVAGLTVAMMSGSAWAQQQPTCDNPNETAVNLNAEARRNVQQDKIMATLSFQADAKTATAAQAVVNQKMQAAKGVYSKYGTVKVSTGGYNVYKTYGNVSDNATPAQREQAANWQASQQLILDGKDKEAIIGLVNALQQQGFAVQGLNYYLSREASDALRDELTAEALASIKQRAAVMAKQLGMSQVRYARIDANNVNIPGPLPVAYRGKMMMAAEAAAAPVVQAGESEVSVNVNADVRMK